jgi:hypothetical protein
MAKKIKLEEYTPYKIQFNKAVTVNAYVKDDPCDVVDVLKYRKGQKIEVQFCEVDEEEVQFLFGADTVDELDLISGWVDIDAFEVVAVKEWKEL